MTEETAGSAGSDHTLNLPTMLVMLLGGVMVTIAIAALSPVLPQISDALARTDTDRLMVKMLVPIVGATMVIGAPLTGFLIDRIPLRRVLVLNSLTFTIAGLSGLILGDLAALLVSRLFVGIAAAGMATVSMTLINTRLHGTARARWMGYHIAAAMLCSLVLLPAIGALGELGWRWPFLAYAGGLAVTVSAVSGLQDLDRRSAGAALPRTIGNAAGNPLRWFPLLFVPLALVMGGVTYLPAVYLPFVVHAIGITSPTLIAMIMLADALIGAGMALLFGRSQRFVASEAAFLFSFSCTGSGMLIAGLSTSIVGVVAGMLVFGFGTGWLVPNLMISLARRVSAGRQGRAVGIVKGAHYLASPLAIMAVEPIARAFGPRGAMVASACASFAVAGCFVYLVLRPGVRSARHEPVPAE